MGGDVAKTVVVSFLNLAKLHVKKNIFLVIVFALNKILCAYIFECELHAQNSFEKLKLTLRRYLIF